jgi:hypothetical protein
MGAYPAGFVPESSQTQSAYPAGFVPDTSTPAGYKVVTPGNDTSVAEEMNQAQGKWTPEMLKGAIASKLDSAKQMIRPALEGGGAVIGGLVGTAGGAALGLGGGPAAPATVPYGAIAGGVAGSGLGYAMGARAADLIEGKQRTLGNAMTQSAQDVGTGAMLDMGGQSVVPAVQMLGKGVGSVVKPMLGRMSGTGEAAINEAIESGKSTGITKNPLASSTDFDKALRGEISGEEVVDNARTALSTLKDQRADAYRTQLAQVAQNTEPIDLRPLKTDLSELMDKYNVKVGEDGNLDLSRIAMGKSGRGDIKDVIETVSNWGTKEGDNTPLGLDVLKRQLDDFYSDSSQARQFVASMRNKVKDTIVENVPEYAEMTKGYAEATSMIKDIESGLMMRKQGISGRIVADQTLRRLTSAMRDNFPLRNDLVNTLSTNGGVDVAGQVAGYSLSPAIPKGFAGTLAVGEAAAAKFLNPKLWPLFVASSPRVQGEFLRLFGQALAESGKLPPDVARGLAVQLGIQLKGANNENK